MKRSFQTFMLTALVIFAAMTSFGQVYSAYANAGGVASRTLFSIGSPSFRFALEEYGYSTDSSGFNTMWRKPLPGDKEHWFSRVSFGPVSFSTSLRPAAVIAIGSSLMVTIIFLVASLGSRAYRHQRYGRQVA